jgi:DNA-binding transcriptional LysR family regulator
MEHRAERRAIVELARLGNARHTAEFLGVSKSTISEVGVRRERSYGTRLFDRDRRACGRDG